jgi:hypothetical protein
MFVMVKCGVLCEVRAEVLNSIKTSFGFKGLIMHMDIFALQIWISVIGPRYPLVTIGTVPRAYNILGPTKEWKGKQN